MMIDYCEKDIIEKLKLIGVEQGNDVFIHSNLGFFGRLENCNSAVDLCETFVRALKYVIGENGTIVAPTFSYSYCHNEIFNPELTKTTCGLLSEYMIHNYSENRSLDPNFSICGLGPNMIQYKTCNIHESFGEGAFWEVFLKNNGKIVCMNFDAGSTFVHYIERKNNVSYRYNKAFNGVTQIGNDKFHDYAVHFVYENTEDAPCMERVDKLCREHRICKEEKLGRGTILAFSVSEYYDFFTDLLKTRPRVFCREE